MGAGGGRERGNKFYENITEERKQGEATPPPPPPVTDTTRSNQNRHTMPLEYYTCTCYPIHYPTRFQISIYTYMYMCEQATCAYGKMLKFTCKIQFLRG